MKPFLIFTLCLLVALGGVHSVALAQTPIEAQAILNAKSYLTEVYGYTVEDAEAFDFRFSEANEQQILSFAPKAHPNWAYTARVDREDGSLSEATCPFTTGYESYPGQNAVQGVLYEAREKGWFENWDQNAMAELKDALHRFEIQGRGASSLYGGLNKGGLSAAGAIQGFFEACYGEPLGWTGATKEWRDDVLSSYGLTLEAALEAERSAGGNLSYVTTNTREGAAATVTQFEGEVPQALTNAFAHPKLAGWTPLCGAYATFENREDIPQRHRPPERGLAAFGRGEDRLLVMLHRQGGSEEWQVVPVGERALLPGRELSITYSPEENLFTLSYPVSATERESFRVAIQYGNGENQLLCQLVEYRHVDDAKGKGVVIDNHSEKFNLSEHWYHLTQYAAEHPAVEEMADKTVPGYLDYIDVNAFPRTAEACKAADSYALPENCGVVMGVHLRKETSSRSADLGLYEPGTIVNVLETVPGNPHPWAHVRIGSAEGYMSTVYVDYLGSECAMEPLAQAYPLSVAAARQSVALKAGTGWFDSTVKELPAGTKMHVLATLGDWLHVMIPSQGEPGWLMDVNGTDGYVKAGDVKIAATSLQLDWLQ